MKNTSNYGQIQVDRSSHYFGRRKSHVGSATTQLSQMVDKKFQVDMKIKTSIFVLN